MREEKYFVHSHALVENGARIGAGTRVWAFVHVLPDAVIGGDCNICDHVFIENGVKIGDRVTIKCGVYLWDGVEIEDDVFVGSAAVFTNDRLPRSGNKKFIKEKTFLRKGCSIGAGAVILPGVEIGAGAMVGAGSVVTRTVPPFAVVAGNPARVIRFLEGKDNGAV